MGKVPLIDLAQSAPLLFTNRLKPPLLYEQSLQERGQIFFRRFVPSIAFAWMLAPASLSSVAKTEPDHRTSKPHILAPLPTTAPESADFAALPSGSIVSCRWPSRYR